MNFASGLLGKGLVWFRTPQAGEGGGDVCLQVPRELLVRLWHHECAGAIVSRGTGIVVGGIGICAACTELSEIRARYEYTMGWSHVGQTTPSDMETAG